MNKKIASFILVLLFLSQAQAALRKEAAAKHVSLTQKDSETAKSSPLFDPPAEVKSFSAQPEATLTPVQPETTSVAPAQPEATPTSAQPETTSVAPAQTESISTGQEVSQGTPVAPAQPEATPTSAQPEATPTPAQPEDNQQIPQTNLSQEDIAQNKDEMTRFIKSYSESTNKKTVDKNRKAIIDTLNKETGQPFKDLAVKASEKTGAEYTLTKEDLIAQVKILYGI